MTQRLVVALRESAQARYLCACQRHYEADLPSRVRSAWHRGQFPQAQLQARSRRYLGFEARCCEVAQVQLQQPTVQVRCGSTFTGFPENNLVQAISMQLTGISGNCADRVHGHNARPPVADQFALISQPEQRLLIVRGRVYQLNDTPGQQEHLLHLIALSKDHPACAVRFDFIRRYDPTPNLRYPQLKPAVFMDIYQHVMRIKYMRCEFQFNVCKTIDVLFDTLA